LSTACFAIAVAGCGGGGSTPPQKPEPDPVSTPDAAPQTTDDETPPTAALDGPGGFPLPVDATPSTQPGMNVDSIKSFMVPRGREVAAAEVKALLVERGWTIDSEDVSPRGSIRLATTDKEGKQFKVSFAGDDTQAAIIITLP
jgi:hypothetical protein